MSEAIIKVKFFHLGECTIWGNIKKLCRLIKNGKELKYFNAIV